MLKIDMEIKGVDEFLRTVREEVAVDKKHLDKLLTRAALETHKNAVESIKNGGRSGKIYKRGQKTHQASAPGEAPKTDYGTLVKNITFQKADMTVGSRGGAPWGFWLEFGTSKAGARPWLQPAFDRMVKWFDSNITFGGFK